MRLMADSIRAQVTTSSKSQPPQVQPGPPDELPAVLTVDELASLLRLNRKTVYESIQKGEIPGARRLGRTIRISRDAVLVWLSQDRTAASTKRR